MNKQEMFNTVARHLLSQGKKSGWGKSLYIDPDGLKCAVGSIMPEDVLEYVVEEEHNSRKVEVLPKSILSRIIPEGSRDKGIQFLKDLQQVKGIQFLKDLQQVHDHNNPVKWKSKLVKVADEWDLSTEVLDKSVEDMVNELDLNVEELEREKVLA